MRGRWERVLAAHVAILSELEGLVQRQLQREGAFREIKEQKGGTSGAIMRGPGAPRAWWKGSPFSV